ncbi:unannotated protein [freshwater metagenome]|uniref:Unannotated protein n=1 Tax=freshwater metagenome TaxID=449393 RepID=A0A6J6P1K1_9ZZZZ
MSTPARSERLVLVSLALLTTVTAIVSSLGAPLVPAIAAQYDVALGDAQWALTAALLCGAVTTPLVGRLGSGRLRRPVILGGLLVVMAGTALSALPLGFAVLVAGRAMQGVGMALVPLAIATARDAIAPDRLASAVALLSVTTVAGAGLGYPVTAVVADLGGLPLAYALGTVLTSLTLVMAWRYVPGRPGEEPAHVDVVGAGLVGAGMVATLLAVSQGESWGWASPRTLVVGALGLLVLGGWLAWSLRTPRPLVDLRLAVRPGLAGPNLVAFAAGIGMYTLLTLVVVVVQAEPHDGFGLGLPVAVAGLMLVPYSLMSVAGSRLAQSVSRRWGTGLLLPTGCGLFLAATLLLAVRHDHLAELIAWMALGGLGSGFTFSSLAVLMVPHVPRSETGSAVAFNQVLRYLGFSVGSSLSIALSEIYGDGERGFRGSLLTLSSVWVAAAIGTSLLARRTSPTIPT